MITASLHQLLICVSESLVNVERFLHFVPVGFSPPLVGLSRVWVDADGSVAVSDGCVGFLHLNEDTNTKSTAPITQSRN